MWTEEIGRKIFTIVKYRSEKELKSEYPNILFTETDKPKSPQSSFPTVFVRELDTVGVGDTLEGTEEVAIRFSREIKVMHDKSQNDARKVIYHVLGQFKKLGFNITYPSLTNSTTYYEYTARVNRVIGSGDVI